ncbi:PglL family O-oligosaccharyltransferase [Conchiformibius steedae DSM 2580]|uniref:PglL family O-oligosaccharyltransferase n=1 Tax=Conchiformibius steedae DSM 2580 TaxID=1121352 RepID=A0AAE9KZC8_9NEIS|nr:PglL family O-oligosaccharyltransferase [Conchiformibius steedae]URD67703.1 PglL family O-oligosaccharyltransferase [Conchiformibius steedae DSM 2580]
MMSKFPLFSTRLLPLCVGLILVVAVPFLSIWRTGPQSALFLESLSLGGVLVLVLATALSGKLDVRPPAASLWLLLMALFWAVQARVMDLSYIGLSDMAAWSFAILALGVWACRGWVRHIGQERAVAVLAWVLVLACCLQATVGWMQYTGAAAAWKGWLMYRSGIVEGQLGQRNHFGHYLMWGVLATAYLWTTRRMAWWLALPVTAYLGLTLGLTGSRAVLAYFLAIGAALPLWRWLNGNNATRMTVVFAAVLLWTAFAQFAAEPLLQLFQHSSGVDSAAERLANHRFGQSGRDYEWRKAWLVFQSAPWFGHGWGSYALQGFLVDADFYPLGFRPYETNVLFTHSHNSFLNLLAEMGIVGTLLVLGGLAVCVRRAFSQASAASLLLLALLTVSLVHSLVEYPLWYVYFLSAFMLFVGLMPAPESTRPLPEWMTWTVGIGAAMMLVGVVRLGFVYQDLRQAAAKTTTATEKAANITTLLYLSRTEPMLRYYADMTLLNHVDTAADHIPAWAQTARESARYRPYANAHKWGLLAYRAGEHQAAADWMRQMYRYYPSKYPVYGAAIMTPPHYRGLQAQYSAECRAYYATIKKPPVCAEAMPPKPPTKP